MGELKGLRISILLTSPEFPDVTRNGCEATLVPVVRHLARRGADTTVYYPTVSRSSSTREPYPGLTVKPLRISTAIGKRPEECLPFQFADILGDMTVDLREYDILYIHGGARFLPCRNRVADMAGSVVTSIHDLVYPTSLLGAFGDTRGSVFTISRYLGDCFSELTKRISGTRGNVLAIENGFSATEFLPTDTRAIRSEFELSDEEIPILFPHRANDPSKGIRDTLRAVEALEDLLDPATYANVRLLVPETLDSEIGGRPEASSRVVEEANSLGLGWALRLHKWVPRSRMREYYSLGVATACFGTFPESFGNIQVESLLCGTPPIVSRVGAQRTVFPEGIVRKIDPGDVVSAASHLADVLREGDRVSRETREYTLERYSLEKMVSGYERALLQGRQVDAAVIPENPPVGISSSTVLTVPPWCAALDNGYYNDYTGYLKDERFSAILPDLQRGATVGNVMSGTGVTLEEIQQWIDDGQVSCD